MKTESAVKHTPPSFESVNEAFDYCREKDQPVIVILNDTVQGDYGKYKLYPSGRADQIARCLCGSLDNHMCCPTHGDPQFVDWNEEKKQRLIAAAPAMLEALEACVELLNEVQRQEEGELSMPWPDIDKAEAAIRLAKGEL